MVPVPISAVMCFILSLPSGDSSINANAASPAVPKLLHRGKTHAVAHAGMGSLVLGLALGTVHPHRILGGQGENLADAQLTRRHGALGVAQTCTQHVLLAQRDGIHADLLGNFIDQHFGRSHGLQRAVAAHRPRRDLAAGEDGHRQIALGKVVHRLRRSDTKRAHRRAEVHGAAAIAAHVHREGLNCPWASTAIVVLRSKGGA